MNFNLPNVTSNSFYILPTQQTQNQVPPVTLKVQGEQFVISLSYLERIPGILKLYNWPTNKTEAEIQENPEIVTMALNLLNQFAHENEETVWSAFKEKQLNAMDLQRIYEVLEFADFYGFLELKTNIRSYIFSKDFLQKFMSSSLVNEHSDELSYKRFLAEIHLYFLLVSNEFNPFENYDALKKSLNHFIDLFDSLYLTNFFQDILLTDEHLLLLITTILDIESGNSSNIYNRVQITFSLLKKFKPVSFAEPSAINMPFVYSITAIGVNAQNTHQLQTILDWALSQLHDPFLVLSIMTPKIFALKNNYKTKNFINKIFDFLTNHKQFPISKEKYWQMLEYLLSKLIDIIKNKNINIINQFYIYVTFLHFKNLSCLSEKLSPKALGELSYLNIAFDWFLFVKTVSLEEGLKLLENVFKHYPSERECIAKAIRKFPLDSLLRKEFFSKFNCEQSAVSLSIEPNKEEARILRYLEQQNKFKAIVHCNLLLNRSYQDRNPHIIFDFIIEKLGFLKAFRFGKGFYSLHQLQFYDCFFNKLIENKNYDQYIEFLIELEKKEIVDKKFYVQKYAKLAIRLIKKESLPEAITIIETHLVRIFEGNYIVKALYNLISRLLTSHLPLEKTETIMSLFNLKREIFYAPLLLALHLKLDKFSLVECYDFNCLDLHEALLIVNLETLSDQMLENIIELYQEDYEWTEENLKNKFKIKREQQGTPEKLIEKERNFKGVPCDLFVESIKRKNWKAAKNFNPDHLHGILKLIVYYLKDSFNIEWNLDDGFLIHYLDKAFRKVEVYRWNPKNHSISQQEAIALYHVNRVPSEEKADLQHNTLFFSILNQLPKDSKEYSNFLFNYLEVVRENSFLEFIQILPKVSCSLQDAAIEVPSFVSPIPVEMVQQQKRKNEEIAPNPPKEEKEKEKDPDVLEQQQKRQREY